MTDLSGATLRGVQLGRPGWGKKGYDIGEVDVFLARAADALDAHQSGRTPGMTAEEVHDVVFRKPGLGKGRGYDEDQVDELLDHIESALRGGSVDGIQLNGRPLPE
jgi:DivIVA domain-containing protein